MITVFPAIDLLNKKCVRLSEGDFAQKKEYSDHPLEVAKGFSACGFGWVHVVDLDGARTGSPKNLEIIKSITLIPGMNVQVGGGIRDFEVAEKYFNMGASRIILGSAAVANPDFFRKCQNSFGVDKVVLALDVKGEEIAVSGWQALSGISIFDFLQDFSGKHVLVTDIASDGRLEGPNFMLYEKLMASFPGVNFIASGGVSDLDDIKQLCLMGIEEVVVGKAIYEEKIKLEDFSAFAKKPVCCGVG